MYHVFVSLIVKIAFVLGVCACNLISVVACCDSLYVRINFDVKKTATGHRIAKSKSIFVTTVELKEDVVMLRASFLKFWV